MRKKICLCLLCLFTIINLAGCLDKNSPESVLEHLKRSKTSSSDVIVRVNNAKQDLEYRGKQLYSRKYGSVFTLNDERKFILKDEKIYVEDVINNSTYTQDKSLDIIIKYTFIQEYLNMIYSNGELKYTFIKDEENKKNHYLMVDFILPGTNRNLDNATLYIDLDSNLPSKVEVFDFEGIKTIDITYENYKTNISTSESDFDIQESKE